MVGMRKELLLCRIETKENVGSIYRLAYQFGITKIYSYLSAAPGKTNTYKTERHSPIEIITSLNFLKDYDLPKIALEMGSSTNHFKFNQEYLLAVGNESHGFEESELSLFDTVVTLKGIVRDSYNVSHALAIALYNASF